MGETSFGNTNTGSQPYSSARRTPRFVGVRPVTEESRLVTALILLVNPGIRKHGIPVSGLTRRRMRRVATSLRDDRLRGHEVADLGDGTSSWSTGKRKAQRAPIWHPFAPNSTDQHNYRESPSPWSISVALGSDTYRYEATVRCLTPRNERTRRSGCFGALRDDSYGVVQHL